MEIKKVKEWLKSQQKYENRGIYFIHTRQLGLSVQHAQQAFMENMKQQIFGTISKHGNS